MAQYTYKTFNLDEDVIAGKQKLKTFPIWSDSPSDSDSNPEAILTTFFTSSIAVDAWEGNYFYNIYSEDTVSTYNLESQFSISIGTTGSLKLYDSSTDVGDEYRYTYPSAAIYKQMSNNILGRSSNTPFVLSTGTIMPIIHIISIARSRLKDGVEPDTWSLTINSEIYTNSTASYSGENIYDIVNSSGTVRGIFYSDYGIFIFDSNGLAADGSIINPVTTLAIQGSGDNSGYEPEDALKDFYNKLKTGAYFKARTNEKVQSTHYFVRIKNFEFNSSGNPTWVTGSSNVVKDEFYEESKTFITSVGLYDGAGDSGRLVSVSKLSRPLLKTEDSEALIRVRLDF